MEEKKKKKTVLFEQSKDMLLEMKVSFLHFHLRITAFSDLRSFKCIIMYSRVWHFKVSFYTKWQVAARQDNCTSVANCGQELWFGQIAGSVSVPQKQYLADLYHMSEVPAKLQ